MTLTVEEKKERNRIACAKWKAKKSLEDPMYEKNRQAEYDRTKRDKLAKREQNQAFRERDREHFNQLCNKAYHKFKHNSLATSNSPEYKLWMGCKKRARQLGREFSIELSDIVIPEVCPVLGIPIKIKQRVADGSYLQNHSPSVDRVDNSRGYVKGNIEVISYKANRLKAHGSLEDFKKIVEYLQNRDNDPAN